MGCCAVDTLGGVPVGQTTEPGMALYRAVFDFTEEGFASNRMMGWVRTLANGGTVFINVAGGIQDSRHPGTVGFSLDFGNVGGASAATLRRSVAGLEAGDGALTFDLIYQMLVLPDANDDWFVYLGEGDSNTGLPADGFGFVFDRTISTTEWLFVSRAAGVGVPVTTGITAVAGTWVRMRAIINADRTAVDFFFDENLGAGLVNVGQFAATIPGAGQRFSAVMGHLEVNNTVLPLTLVGTVDLFIEEKEVVPARP